MDIRSQVPAYPLVRSRTAANAPVRPENPGRRRLREVAAILERLAQLWWRGWIEHVRSSRIV